MKRELLLSILTLFIFSAASNLQAQTVDSTGIFEAIEAGSAKTILHATVIYNDEDNNDEYDASFVLSAGPISSWGDYSAAVSFYTDGVQVRDGGSFTNTNNVLIENGTKIDLWIDVNVESKTYTTWIQTPSLDSKVLIHENAEFRRTDIDSIAQWSCLHNSGGSQPNDYLTLHKIELVGESSAIDVTDDYLVNASFDETPNFTVDATDDLGTSTDGSTVLDVPGWTATSNHYSVGGSFEYGTVATLNGSAVPATNANENSSGASLGLQGAWTGWVTYYQEVTLQPGEYKLSYKAYNSKDAEVGISLAGWLSDSDTILSTLSGFPTMTWTSDEVVFTVETETTGKIQIGFMSENKGSGSHARVFIDDVSLLYKAAEITLSPDATLAQLSVDNGALDPAFDAATAVYSVLAPAGTTTVKVSATANDSNASISGDGDIDVSSGSGTATVVVTAEDGSTETYTINITVEEETKVNDISQSIASVYPTITNGNVTVKFANTPGTISVYEISGAEIYTKKAETLNETINIDGQRGIYFILVQSEGVKNIFKVIKRN